MQQFLALLRGLNVGGANRLPMSDLRKIAGQLGWQNVCSYRSSGNLVFRATGPHNTLAERLEQSLFALLGLQFPVLVLSKSHFETCLDECPFDAPDPTKVHGFLYLNEPKPDQALQESLISPRESLVLRNDIAWLNAPDGIGRSKLVSRIDAALGTATTSRNLQTLRALSGLFSQDLKD